MSIFQKKKEQRLILIRSPNPLSFVIWTVRVSDQHMCISIIPLSGLVKGTINAGTREFTRDFSLAT